MLFVTKHNTGSKPPATWPSKGEIVFKNLVVKYGDDAPILKNITCVFKSQEKVHKHFMWFSGTWFPDK